LFAHKSNCTMMPNFLHFKIETDCLILFRCHALLEDRFKLIYVKVDLRLTNDNEKSHDDMHREPKQNMISDESLLFKREHFVVSTSKERLQILAK